MLIDRYLADPRPGVTEILAHPAIGTDELRAIAPDADRRVEDHQLLGPSSDLRDRLRDVGVTTIGYRALRDLQRAA